MRTLKSAGLCSCRFFSWSSSTQENLRKKQSLILVAADRIFHKGQFSTASNLHKAEPLESHVVAHPHFDNGSSLASLPCSRKLLSTQTIPFDHLSPPKGLPFETLPSSEEVFPYEDIPSPKGIPIFGTLFDLIKAGGARRVHEYTDQRFKELGPIYRETLGNVEAVFICDPVMIREVYRKEGRYPLLMLPEPWSIYNRKYKRKRGLLFMTGEEWSKYRKLLSKPFLSQTNVHHHYPEFQRVTEEVIQKWRALPERSVIPDLEKQIYQWFVECTGVMLFGSRLGCLSDGNSSVALDNFVDAVKNVFEESSVMTMFPPNLAASLNLPVWKRFKKACDTAFEIAEGFVRSAIARHNQRHENSILGCLLNANVKTEDIVRILIDLFLASADTSSHTTQWSLHLLAKHEQVQERIRRQVDRISNGSAVSEGHLPHLSLVKGLVKEAQRLHSVAPFLTRITTEQFTVNGYTIPAGKLILMSLYTSGRDEKNFPEPLVVSPERWMREAKGTQRSVNTTGFQPFGMGQRSCIGKRMAELNMHLIIARLLQNFYLKSENKENVETVMRLVAVPSAPIEISLIDRKTP